MSKITFQDYQRLLVSDEVDDQRVLSYSRVVKGEGGFDFELRPDPDKVAMTAEDREVENAMQIGNGLARYRRKKRFSKRRKKGVDLPVLVSEGDSWFQFPFLIREVIDHLEPKYLIWSVGAAGDTAKNMIFGPERKGKTEYLQALRKERDNVRGFLFSAAGNDIIGEDPETGRSALFDILKPFNSDTGDVAGHINVAVLGERLSYLRNGYQKVIAKIRAEPGLERLPIFVHGYDYVFPYPWRGDDPRDPVYAKNNEWLGEPMERRGIQDTGLRRSILKTLIDAVYDMLHEVAGDSDASAVWVVNCRKAMPDLTDWNDEIHGTSDGFAKVAARFSEVIEEALR